MARRDDAASVGFELEVDRTFEHSQVTPSAFSGAVTSQQACRQCVLVERAGSSQDRETFREVKAVAPGAVDGRTKVGGPPISIEHPSSLLERRPVTDMLVVVAGQLRHPLIVAVTEEADDGPDHRDNWWSAVLTNS